MGGGSNDGRTNGGGKRGGAKKGGLPKLCTEPAFTVGLIEGGCSRYVRGFDITGVTNLINAGSTPTFCDCMNLCKEQGSTCASWVWKFTAPDQTTRQCTLYSNFNLPPNVIIDVNLAASTEGVNGGNPQAGGLIPPCTLDSLATGTPDPECASGGLWIIGANEFLC